MARRRFAPFFLVVAVLLIGACDHAPVDPLDPRVDLSTLLAGSGAPAGHAAALSMPGLLQAAVHKVYAEQGAAAAQTLFADLRRLHEQAQRVAAEAADDSDADRFDALRAEEIRILLSVFGDPLAGRVIDAVAEDAQRLELSIAELESAGTPPLQAHASLAQIRALLAHGTDRVEQGNAAAALDAAARASVAAEALRDALVYANRVPTVETLFDQAIARLRERPDAAAARAGDRYDALQKAAQEAVRAGNTDRTYAALQALRTEQIRLVLSVSGPDAADQLLQGVKRASAEVEQGLSHARSVGRDVYRLDRMLETARDLYSRAAQALVGGDGATALDLGSHAAALVNTIRITLAAN